MIHFTMKVRKVWIFLKDINFLIIHPADWALIFFARLHLKHPLCFVDDIRSMAPGKCWSFYLLIHQKVCFLSCSLSVDPFVWWSYFVLADVRWRYFLYTFQSTDSSLSLSLTPWERVCISTICPLDCYLMLVHVQAPYPFTHLYIERTNWILGRCNWMVCILVFYFLAISLDDP